jgi:hypothetical protein
MLHLAKLDLTFGVCLSVGFDISRGEKLSTEHQAGHGGIAGRR